eukprot:TRINITY_DN1640_c0_g1_i2.p1 TRINITY_DN1640_c0_g1~~TRINITY_DN1640_c0_g1_i2.p1  ORF type:complete len:647 (+),score=199.54 TRINITY_DN1640_c0_g1_i2:196-1941(+)
MKIISSVLKIHEINDRGVGAVLNIAYDREKLPGTPVIYFLSPTKESIEAMIDDYASGRPRYGNAFLFTTGPLNSDLTSKLGSARIVDHLQDFREVRIDFQASEQRLALLGRKGTIPTLYFPSSERQKSAEIDRTAAQLASLCICLKELPYIRYYDNANGLCQAIATQFESQISAAARELSDWKYNEMRGTLLILDRSLDPISPLMHEYTYQAMVNDVLNVEGAVVTLTKTASGVSEDSKGPFLLDDEEDLFKEMRHQHISEVTQEVTSRFNKFKAQNATAKFQGTDDVKEMLAVAKALPQYRAEMKKYTKHMTLAEACFDAFDERKLRDISHLEQDMATGVDEDGKKTTKKQLQERLVEKIQSRDIRTIEKLRLLMIYIISQDGIDVATRKQLFSIADFSASQEEAVQNLVSLGVTLQSSSKKASAKVLNAERIRKAKDKARTVPLELMRFTPFIGELLQEFAAGTLPKNPFRYLKDKEPPASEANVSGSKAAKAPGPVRSVRQSRWREQTAEEKKYVDETPTTPRLIIFVAGGVTFSEVREAYEAAKVHSRDVIICSTHTLNAEQFIDELRPIEEGKGDS